MTTHDTSWRLGDATSSPVNRAYDALRRGLNGDLVRYFERTALAGNGPYRVLEAGSGTAFASSLLVQHPSVRLGMAIDHDAEALGEGHARDAQLATSIADIFRLPFADGSFDLVWNSSTLEHLGHTQQALAEMARVVRPGGYLFTGVPFIYGPLGFQKWIAQTGIGVWIGTVFDRSTLEGLIRETGLQPCDSMIYFFRFFIGILAQKPS
jgi:ubiquinone/menaquinone biosynthesis C-methylase UbiE